MRLSVMVTVFKLRCQNNDIFNGTGLHFQEQLRTTPRFIPFAGSGIFLSFFSTVAGGTSTSSTAFGGGSGTS